MRLFFFILTILYEKVVRIKTYLMIYMNDGNESLSGDGNKSTHISILVPILFQRKKVHIFRYYSLDFVSSL